MKTIVPTWLCIGENTAITYFGAEFAQKCFNDGYQVFKARIDTGVLDYDTITRLEDIVDEYERLSAELDEPENFYKAVNGSIVHKSFIGTFDEGWKNWEPK